MTTLSDNLQQLPTSKYRVNKFQVANPADVDGDCIDDITELADLGTKQPLNPAESVNSANGTLHLADRAAFQQNSYQGNNVEPIDGHLASSTSSSRS